MSFQVLREWHPTFSWCRSGFLLNPMKCLSVFCISRKLRQPGQSKSRQDALASRTATNANHSPWKWRKENWFFFSWVKPKNKILIYTTLNVSEIHTQLLLVNSVAEDMTQYHLYFFFTFVPRIGDALKFSHNRISILQTGALRNE